MFPSSHEYYLNYLNNPNWRPDLIGFCGERADGGAGDFVNTFSPLRLLCLAYCSLFDEAPKGNSSRCRQTQPDWPVLYNAIFSFYRRARSDKHLVCVSCILYSCGRRGFICVE